MPSWQETAEGKINKQQYHKKNTTLPTVCLCHYAVCPSASLSAMNPQLPQGVLKSVIRACESRMFEEGSTQATCVWAIQGSTSCQHQAEPPRGYTVHKKNRGGGVHSKRISVKQIMNFRSANTNKENDVKHMYVNQFIDSLYIITSWLSPRESPDTWLISCSPISKILNPWKNQSLIE